ncbi:MAG: SgcJ/EcaC family oxidoreductase [Hyphomonadaceae bacterium]|nr:SgcJ/EcaC family oxidoreductase [Hyphomonadaceae bacterium]
MLRLGIVVAAFAALAACAPATEQKAADASATAATAPTEADVAALFDRWNAALATGNPDTVAALYAEDAVLEPTVSNNVRSTPQEIREYFVEFLPSRPQGTINERYIDILGDNVAMDQGVYTFDLPGAAEGRWVTARYTFVYTREPGGEWKIEHHHSSAMPEPVTQRPAPLAAAATPPA